MSKQIEITLEQAKELLVTTPSLKDIIYSNFPELKPSVVLDSFMQLKKLSGWYTDARSRIFKLSAPVSEFNKNIFKTKQQAESALAMAQLSQLMAATRDCNIDWSNERLRKYCIDAFIKKDGSVKLAIKVHISAKLFLAFNTQEIAEEFLARHSDLIKQYYNY